MKELLRFIVPTSLAAIAISVVLELHDITLTTPQVLVIAVGLAIAGIVCSYDWSGKGEKMVWKKEKVK